MFYSAQRRYNGELQDLLFTIFCIFYAFGVLLMACECGQGATTAFERCSEIVDQFAWYLFPAEIQRMLPMVLAFTQKPIDIKCFGSAACDRDLFKYVSINIEPTQHSPA